MATERTAFDLEAVRGELARVRNDAVDAGTNSALAATLNFVIYVDETADRAWILERALKIQQKHPSRAIVLDASSDDGTPKVETCAALGADCATVASERVTFGVKNLSAARIAELAYAISTPDLPTTLWWTSTHVHGNPAFAMLADAADNVLVDSSGNVDDDGTIEDLATYATAHKTGTLHDFAWLRLAPWHDAIAQCFDDEELAKELFAIRSLRIAAGSEAEALYLSGWMGSKLGWNACGPNEYCDRSGAKVAFTYERQGDSRRVSAVHIGTAHGEFVATYEQEGSVVRFGRTGGGAERFVPLHAMDSLSLIERAILEPATDANFEDALATVGSLLRQ